MFINRNAIWAGLLVGVIIPFVSYAVLLSIYDYLETAGYVSKVGFSPTFRQRTLSVLAICLNVIPINIYKRKNYTESMRGIVFPTAVYVIAWIIYFGKYIF